MFRATPKAVSTPQSTISIVTKEMEDDPTSLASSSRSASSPSSAFHEGRSVKSLMPFSRYSTGSYVFPPLTALIQYCCEIDLKGKVDETSLARLLDLMQTEFKRHKAREGKGFAEIKEQIVGYLNFSLVNLEEMVVDKSVSKVHGRMCGLFSDALTKFLKNTRSKEEMAAGASASSAASSVAAAAEVVVEKKYKLTELGRKLLIAIGKNKIYEIEALLRDKPELAIEGNEKLTILTEAAFNGHVDILKLVVETLNKLASEGELPRGYYGRLVGKGEDNKLPAVLWAAVSGKYDALQYLWSIEDVKTSLKLEELEEVIEEVLERHEEEKKPNPYKEISEFLQIIHSELSPPTRAKESTVKAKDGAGDKIAISSVQSLRRAIHVGNVKKVHELLIADANIAVYSNSKYSILSEATCFGNLKIVKLVMARLPIDYNYGQFLGRDDIETPQSAVLMAALAGQIDSLKYLFSVPRVIASIAPREILSVIKKLECFLSGEKDEEALEEEYGWSISKFKISTAVYAKIHYFLEDFYFKVIARAEVAKTPTERYLDCIVPGRGTLLFSPPRSNPFAGSKRRHDLTDTEKDTETEGAVFRFKA
jgi:hypothetical protein